MENCKQVVDNMLIAIGVILMAAVMIVPTIGWVLNIVKLFPMEGATGMLVLRGVGVLIAPLGAVLGFIG